MVVVAPNNPQARRSGKNQQQTKRSIAKRYPFINNRDTPGLRLNRFMMMPLEGPPVRLPTRDAPAVAVATMRYLTQYNESFSKENVFGGKSYMAMVYGQPGLTHADGPFNVSGLLACAFTPHAILNPTPSTANITNQLAWVSSPLVMDERTDASTEPDRDYELRESWPLGRVDVPKEWQEKHSFPAHYPVLESHGKRWLFMHNKDMLTIEMELTAEVFSGTAGVTVFIDVFMLTANGPQNIKDYQLEWSYSTYPNGVMSQNFPGPFEDLASSSRPLFGAWINMELRSVRRLANEKIHRVALGVTVMAGDAIPRLRMNYIKDLASAPDMARELRRTACTLLVSNYSNDYVAQGNLNCARLLPGYPGCPSYSEFIDARGAFQGHAKEGCYTYCEFAAEDEIFQHHLTELAGPLCRPQATMCNVITIQNPGWQHQPNMYQITCDVAVEFKTSSQLFIPLVSQLSVADLDFARRVNNSTLWFFENPSHFETIWKYIVTAWNAARNHSTAIGTAASVLFPEAAPLIMPVARALQRRRN